MGQWQKVGVSQWADGVAVDQAVVAGHWDGDWHLEVGRRDSLQAQEKQACVKEVERNTAQYREPHFSKKNLKCQTAWCLEDH